MTEPVSGELCAESLSVADLAPHSAALCTVLLLCVLTFVAPSEKAVSSKYNLSFGVQFSDDVHKGTNINRGSILFSC